MTDKNTSELPIIDDFVRVQKTTNEKAVIFYFSGTGNAKQVAWWFSEAAARKNVDCQIVNIENVAPESIILTPDTLVGIISPVHGFNYPKITSDFIKRFPKGNRHVFLMCTRGGAKLGNFVTPGLSGATFFLSSFRLRCKGYKIVGMIPFDMPSNWLSLHPAINEKNAEFIRNKIRIRAEKHANKIFAAETDFVAYRDLVQDILILPVSGSTPVTRKQITRKVDRVRLINLLQILGAVSIGIRPEITTFESVHPQIKHGNPCFLTIS